MGAGLVYSRFNHPNSEIVEDRLSVYERADKCALFSSGMSAIATTILAFVRPGDVILHSQPLYGGTETLFARRLPVCRSERSPLPTTSMKLWSACRRKMPWRKGRVAMIFIETPANPTNGLVDIAMVRRVCRRDRPRPGTYAARRLRQHAAGARISAANRTRCGYFVVLADEIYRRSFGSHRGSGPRLKSPHERHQGAARSHRHPTGPAFLLDAQPFARNT